jgi:hypothetical protein
MDSQPIKDSSGYGKDATFTGTPRTTRPIVAKGIAAQLLDTGDSISYPIDNIMIKNREARSFTLEAWVKPSYGNTKILARDNSGLFIDGLKLRFSIDMGNVYSVEYKNLKVGDIYHVVAIYDVKGIYLFLNGVKVAGMDITTPAVFDDTIATLSSSTNSNLVLDSVATYPYALPASVIASHYTLGTSYPSVTNLSKNNGGNHYDFVDSSVSVYVKTAFPDTRAWTTGISDPTLGIVSNELVNLYSDTDGEFQAGTWTYQESFEIDAGTTIVNSRILWDASDDITAEKSEDGGVTWTALTNGGQIVYDKSLTSGYSVSIRLGIPVSAEQISVEYLSVAFYSSLNIKGADEDLPATAMNPTATFVAEKHYPAASFNDRSGISLSSGSAGLSIPRDDVFGGYFAIEMTIRVDSGANSATILYVDTASSQPTVSTDATGKWTFSNLTALYVDGVSISSGTTVAPGEWHHVLAVFAESLAAVYIGNNKTATAGYPMRIGHLATYSDPVSSTDAQFIYNAWVGAPSVGINDESLVTLTDGDDRPLTMMGLRTITAPILDYKAPGWRYLLVPSSDLVNRSAPSFDDSGWAIGSAPFGDGGAYLIFPASATNWPTGGTALWVRRKVTIPSGLNAVKISVMVDNFVDVYWNGTKVDLTQDGTWTRTGNMSVFPGVHTLAVRADDDPGIDRTFFDINFVKGKRQFKAYSHDWAIVSGG